MMKKFKTQNTIEKETSMLRNYLKIGLRNLWKYKTGTFINVIGLSSGLAAFVLIALFIQDEYRYDRHFKNAADIYRVTVKNYERSGNISRHWAFASAGHAERLKTDYANILHATRIMPGATPDLIVQDKRFPEEEVVFASQDIFKIFNFPFIEGNAENAFEGLYSLVLTRSSAAKLFGDDWQEKRIIGHQVVMAQDNNSIPFTITGIMEDMPEQQHFHFSYLAPIRFLEQLLDEGTMNNVGGNYNWLTYIQTAPGTSMPQLQEHINEEFWDKYMGKLSTGEEARMFYDFEFQPILDIHLTSNLESEIETNGSIQQVYIFSIIGILLLLVACVNYMNIATSHYSRRMKEVGIRKVIGAFKSSLVKQFLTESTLITFISFPLSLLLIQWVLPYLNRFMGKTLIFNPAAQSDLLGLLLVLLIFVSILAGLYPALFLSRINLVKALKGEKVINTSRWNFRSWLVTFQYAVTISLIFAILVIEGQMQYIKKSDPGYEREYVLRVDIPRNSMSDTYKNELLSHPNVMKASYSSRIPTGRLADNWRTRFVKGDSAETINFRLPMISVDPDFLDTYAIDLIAGENFRENKMTVMDGNTTVPGQYIINESAAKALGFIDASEIIGEELIYGSTKGPIIGVMEDFHFESLHSQIVPMLLMFHDDFRHISLKIGTKDIPSTLAHIEDTYAMFD
ncbi:MAG: ABC transporter permease, partial [Bacteroidota bacterium]